MSDLEEAFKAKMVLNPAQEPDLTTDDTTANSSLRPVNSASASGPLALNINDSAIARRRALKRLQGLPPLIPVSQAATPAPRDSLKRIREDDAVEDDTQAKRGKHEETIILEECEYCCCDYDQRDMVCCGNGEHWFCIPCRRKQAEIWVGFAKHDITCGARTIYGYCSDTFPKSKQARFINATLQRALDNLEQEAMLRTTNIEGLERCPTCRYAAICPSIDECQDFHCARPDCELVSCRKCKLKAHLPETCEEVATKRAINAERREEEVKSDSEISHCNKCSMPFIKSYGCDHMTCTHCGNKQCHKCGQTFVSGACDCDEQSRFIRRYLNPAAPPPSPSEEEVAGARGTRIVLSVRVEEEL